MWCYTKFDICKTKGLVHENMLALYRLSGSTFIEVTMIPFLLVMSLFLAGRMATTSEINRRFLLLVISTLGAALSEAVLDLCTDLDLVERYTRIFYALLNANAFCLMTYVATYTKSKYKSIVININRIFFYISIVLLFMFRPDEAICKLFSPGFAIVFVIEGLILQLIYQQSYGNGQFLVMNLLFILLIDSFMLQYVFDQASPFVYTIATLMIVFTFFYMESPTYRRIITAHKEVAAARERAEESIKRAKAANKAKSNFLASTSHEIRTPMNAILGINDMIIDELGEKNDRESRDAALAIRRSGRYLLTLVNNILDISKIEAGKMDLFESDYHLWEVLKECEGYVIHKLNQKPNVRFLLEVDKDMPEHLHGDVVRLKQTLINLLDNSVKYTKEGHVSLKVSAEEREGGFVVKFTIEDTGLGMKPQDLKMIFEPFERANMIETRNIPGAGLGLTLVKHVIEIMNGSMDVSSTYHEGTKFTVELPQRVALDERFTMSEYEEFMNMNEKAKQIEAENDAGPSVWPNAHILIVDDTPVNLVVAKGMLKDTQTKIDTVESGEDAIDKIKAAHYDIVFLDHKMPGMDGIQTLQHAKKYAKDTSFIALTANAGVNARNEYISYGFDDYLPKPFKSSEMLRILKTFLNKKK